MNAKSRIIGVWMASGTLVGALIGAIIGIFSDDWSWVALGIPLGLAIGFGIGAARAFGDQLNGDKNEREDKN